MKNEKLKQVCHIILNEKLLGDVHKVVDVYIDGSHIFVTYISWRNIGRDTIDVSELLLFMLERGTFEV